MIWLIFVDDVNQHRFPMKFLRKIILPITAAAVWISISEFLRNEFLLKSYWTSHYNGLGLTFPSEPKNGAIWGLWSLFYAILIYILSRKFDVFQTTLISWFAAFVLMWVVIANLSVLPSGLLYIAIPLSLLEAFIASWIVQKLK